MTFTLLMQFYNKSDNKTKLILVRFVIAFIFSTNSVLRAPLVHLLPLICYWIFPKLVSIPTTRCLKFLLLSRGG